MYVCVYIYTCTHISCIIYVYPHTYVVLSLYSILLGVSDRDDSIKGCKSLSENPRVFAVQEIHEVLVHSEHHSLVHQIVTKRRVSNGDGKLNFAFWGKKNRDFQENIFELCLLGGSLWERRGNGKYRNTTDLVSVPGIIPRHYEDAHPWEFPLGWFPKKRKPTRRPPLAGGGFLRSKCTYVCTNFNVHSIFQLENCYKFILVLRNILRPSFPLCF